MLWPFVAIQFRSNEHNLVATFLGNRWMRPDTKLALDPTWSSEQQLVSQPLLALENGRCSPHEKVVPRYGEATESHYSRDNEWTRFPNARGVRTLSPIPRVTAPPKVSIRSSMEPPIFMDLRMPRLGERNVAELLAPCTSASTHSASSVGNAQTAPVDPVALDCAAAASILIAPRRLPSPPTVAQISSQRRPSNVMVSPDYDGASSLPTRQCAPATTALPRAYIVYVDCSSIRSVQRR